MLIRSLLPPSLLLFSLSSGVAVLMAMTPALSAETPAVLSTENIFGNAKMGYMAAKRIPEICSKLFCYCGCDLTDNHGSLLDCFTSDHGVDCNICQEEALLALKMQTEGKQLAEIQKAVDQKYVAEYNSVFDQPSETLKKYRENRLWKPTQAELASENVAGKKGAQSGAAAATGTTAGSSNASPASGADSTSTKKGSCCGHK